VHEERKAEVHPIEQARRAFVTLSDAYARRLPIIGPSDKLLEKKSLPRSPPLHWAQKGFIDSRLLLNEEGKLPRFDYYKQTSPIRKGSRTMYLPKTLARKAVWRAYRKRKCVVRLRRHDRFVSVDPPEGLLPATCEGLPEGRKRGKSSSKKKRSRER
jgi:hypothetical protein